MAEQVQEVLDRMVPALAEYIERDIFTCHEISQIVSRRRQSEYLIRRRTNQRKSDFISYIQCEEQLEELRALRTKRIERQLKQQRYNDRKRKSENDDIDDDQSKRMNDQNQRKLNKKSYIGDYHVIQHIHYLYHKLLSKHKDDISLYVQYIAFCKTHKSYTKLSKCYAECLQYHPTAAIAIWIEAASHEYFINSSIQNARILFQRAIRMNSHTNSANSTDPATMGVSELWVQSFALELHFVQKMKGRKAVLLSINNDKNKKQKKDDSQEDEHEHEVRQDNNDDVYKIARIVYDNAIQSAHGINVRFQFLDQCKLFPDTEPLQQYIMQTIQRDYLASSPEAWIAMAMNIILMKEKNNKNVSFLKGDDINGDKCNADNMNNTSEKSNETVQESPATSVTGEVVNTIRKACTTIITSDMFLQGLRFLRTYTRSEYKRLTNDDIASCTLCMDELFQMANDEHYFSSIDLVLEHVRYILSATSNNDVESSTDGATTAAADTSVAILDRYVSHHNSICQSAGNKSHSTIQNHPTNPIPAKLWIKWGQIVFNDKINNDTSNTKYLDATVATTSVLQRGLRSYDMNDPNYLILLLQIVGIKILQSSMDTDNSNDPLLFFDRVQEIILLAPGFLSNTNDSKANNNNLDTIDNMIIDDDDDDNDNVPFLIRDIPSALLNYIACLTTKRNGDDQFFVNINSIRKVYEAIIYKSNILQLLIDTHRNQYFDIVKLLFDTCIAAETDHNEKQHQQNGNSKVDLKQTLFYRKRLYDSAIKLFTTCHKQYTLEYKQRRNDDVVYNVDKSNHYKNTARQLYSHGHQSMSGNVRQIGQRNGIPSFDASSVSFDGTACLRAFRDFQIIHLRNAAATFNDTKKKRNVLKWQDIYKLYSDLNDEDKASWCVETKGAAATSEFLSSSSTDERAYCSFLIQKDKDILRKTIGRLPISHFPWNETSEWAYEDALWLFFGRNQLGNINLDGRPEHTDSVSHDGTWHYQLSGTKRWFLRPTEELEASLANKSRLVPRDQTLHIDCKEGDILIINTRLWFHRTMIPPQRKPSISYARDFRLKNDDPNIAIENGMTNLDGMYATTAIDTDTIIFREEDMPDCELCTSTNPNCEVVELDDGTCAVVSTRTIASGEFFCVKEDSSDESGDD